MSRELRVLHIQKVKGIGGSENHLLTLLPRLKAHGFHATMLVLTGGTKGSSEFVDRMRQSSVETLVYRIRCLLDPLLLVGLLRLLKLRRFDLVHTHLVHADLIGGLAGRLSAIGAPIISTRHGDDFFRSSRVFQRLLGWHSRLPHHLICISDHVKRFSISMERIPEEKITRIYYGLDCPSAPPRRASPKELGVKNGERVIGIVARLVPEKGHSTLLLAFKEVVKRFPSAVLVIVGDGPLRNELVRLTASLRLSQKVRFLGFRRNPAALMPAFDFFVHPSRQEGFGLVFLEAMAAGLPIVATRVSAIPEVVVDGQTGLLVAKDNPTELSSALLRFLSNPELARRMGEAGHERLRQEFKTQKMTRETSRLYEHQIRRLKGRSGAVSTASDPTAAS